MHNTLSSANALIGFKVSWFYFFDVEYIYRFVSLGGMLAKSMTSQRGTLQYGR